MNIEKVFNFIREKRGYEYPFIFKLVNKLPLSDDELHINGYLYLNSSNITSLPDNLDVVGYLDLSHTKITSLPDNLYVGTDLYLYNTPLSRMYSVEVIRMMIEDRGGFVNGIIFL